MLGLGDNFGALRALSVSVAILDRSGLIVAVNEAWKDSGRRYGLRLSNFGVGVDYLHYCEIGSPDSLELMNGLRELLAGKSNFLTRIYPCHSPTERRWFYMIGLPLSGGRRSGIALLHVDITPFFRFPMVASGESTETYESVREVDVDAVARSVEFLKLGSPLYPSDAIVGRKSEVIVAPVGRLCTAKASACWIEQTSVGNLRAVSRRQDEC